MAGVPYHKIDVYLRTLLKKGIAVVQQDQATFFLSRALPCISLDLETQLLHFMLSLIFGRHFSSAWMFLLPEAVV